MTSVSSKLILTERGENWIKQFDANDMDDAKELLFALTLVSHNEFERSITKLITKEAKKFNGPIGLFATRDADPTEPYFPPNGRAVNAVAKGANLGSEARIASLLRNLARAEPTKFLNHPTITGMRQKKCRAIFMVDDFIGSGDRTREFLSYIWKSKTLRSWHSLKLISFRAIAYSATTVGQRKVQRTKASPIVCTVRDCPTFHEMPWPKQVRRRRLNLIKRYGALTSDSHIPLGYKENAAALVFEHGCPDNCPAIFWSVESSVGSWQPLFPKRSVLPAEASAFPPEIAAHHPTFTLIRAGQKRLARSGAFEKLGPLSQQMIVTLALAAKGLRSRTSISYATGLSIEACDTLLSRCVEWGLLTPKFRITEAGAAELAAARNSKADPDRLPPKGVDYYYPRQLRGPVNG